jgi:WD40 repeat protein
MVDMKDGKQTAEFKDSARELTESEKGDPIMRAVMSFNNDVQSRSYAFAMSPDGKQAVLGRNDGIIKILDARSGQVQKEIQAHESFLSFITYTSDGRYFVSGGAELVAKLWDSNTGELVRTFTGHRWAVRAAAFSPDDRQLVTGSGDLTLILWDVASGRMLKTFEGHQNVVRAVAFFPDGKNIVSGGYDGLVKIWDVDSGRLVHTLKGHESEVHSVSVSSDGKRIVSGSVDGTTRIWSVETGEELATFITADNGEWLAITPEGFFAASEKGANLIGAVRGLEIYSIDQFYQSLYRPDVVRQKLSMDREIRSRAAEAAYKLDLRRIFDSKAPPKITIVSPKEGVENPGDGVAVEASLSDEGGGIGRIEWRVNGVTRGVQDLARASTKVGDETKVTHTLVLADGTSVIEMIAYNKANLTASLPAAVSVTVKSSGPRPKPRLHVLAIGINAYRDAAIPALNFSVNDAGSIGAAFLLSKSDPSMYEDVILHGPILDQDVTAANLQREFERLSKIVRPDDVFVLYIAGHGVTEDGYYYFVPYDANYSDFDLLVKTSIDQNTLQDWLTQIAALRSVLIYDTCESGSTVDERSGFRGQQQLVAAEKLSRSMGRTVLSATSDIAGALDGYKKHGIFTYVLLDGFAQADHDGDGRIETDQLAQYLRVQLPALSASTKYGRQDPQVKLSGAPFALIPRADIAEIEKVR